jgi:hypothetical protein
MSKTRTPDQKRILRRLRRAPKEALVSALYDVCTQTTLGPQVFNLIELAEMQYCGASRDECTKRAAEMGVQIRG